MLRREVRRTVGGTSLAAGLLALAAATWGTVLPANAVQSLEPAEGPATSEAPLSGSAAPVPDATAGPTANPTDGVTDPSATASPSPDEKKDTTLTVTDAVFAWSMSRQTNALSHNPGAINLMSAGVANPGRGGAILRENQWKATAGRVSLQKQRGDGSWKTAAWNTVGTATEDPKSDPIGLYGPFSNHRIRVTAGTGEIDARAENASLKWKGTWTVVYYGGNTVFTLSDPEVVVTGGRGELRATAGGWAADRTNPRLWEPVPSERLTVATLSDVDVTDKGLVVTPDYRGIRVEGSEPQRREGADWGSFHPDFVRFLRPMGTDQFWYSTGLQSDWTKLPDPVQVGWKGETPQAPSTQGPSGSVAPQPSNPITERPTTVAPSAAPAIPPAQVPLPSTVPLLTGAEAGVRGLTTGPVQVTAAAEDLSRPVAASLSDDGTLWWTAGGLLSASGLLMLIPVRPRRTP